jgi:hypothetical protein
VNRSKVKVKIGLFLLILTSFLAGQEALVYLDVSGSMRGYAVNSNSSYNQLIRGIRAQVLPEISAYTYSLIRVGEQVSAPIPDTQNHISAYSNTAQYNDNYTQLADAIRNVRSKLDYEQPTANALALLISDGVISDSNAGNDIHQMMTSMKELVENDIYVSIIGIKSLFSGRVFTELAPGNQAISVNNVMRPFLVFLMSRDNSKIERAVQSFERLMQANQVEIRRHKVWPVATGGRINVNPTSLTGQHYSSAGRPFLYGVVGANSITQLRIVGRLGSNHRAEIQLGDMALSEFETVSGRVLGPGDSEVRGLTVDFRNNQFFLVFSRDFLFNSALSNNAMPVTIHLQTTLRNDIQVPDNIWGDWNTDDDRIIENAEKILNLSRFLDQISRDALNHYRTNRFQQQTHSINVEFLR